MSSCIAMPHSPLLSVHNLSVHFPVKQGWFLRKQRGQNPSVVRAVDGISFDLYPGETLGVAGESGCGKSSLARAVLRLIPAAEGNVTFSGQDVFSLPDASMKALRRRMQIIFQDPLASLNPRMTVGDIIAEPLKTHYPDMNSGMIREQVKDMMDRVGLGQELINRYPHEFSGGQCQRIGIARAMILRPELIICDEPVSALDVSIRSQIINLLRRLQAEYNLSLMFISHDLSVLKYISHRIMVLYLGRIMEIAPGDTIFNSPGHPYTKALLSSIPLTNPKTERIRKRILLEGDVPSPANPPSGCVFRTRCPIAVSDCERYAPPEPVGTGHYAACDRVVVLNN